MSYSFKGCCIYKKPLEFGESSSDDDEDECDHCFGHVEKKKKNRKNHNHGGDSCGGHDCGHGADHNHHSNDAASGKENSS